jgi:hypothetical protein
LEDKPTSLICENWSSSITDNRFLVLGSFVCLCAWSNFAFTSCQLSANISYQFLITEQFQVGISFYTTITAMAEIGEATTKAVYRKDESDPGENELDLGFLTSDGIVLTGMCSTNCHEGALWSPDEPYELSRSSFDTEYKPIRQHFLRKSKEPQNYVKALLQSDSELERLSRRIRSQLRQSEMVELSIEAEKAALAGEESFSGKPSTFGGPTQDKLVPVRVKRRQTFSEGIAAVSSPYVDRKLKVLALRDVTEVIPHFRGLHLHMRTHMRRRRVEEDSLVFNEVVDSNESLHLQLASDLATQSMTFFENMTDLSKVQQATQRMIDRSGACSPTLCDMMRDDDSQGSGASFMGPFGKALSSHLSPKSGAGIKRPPLVVPAGLRHPDEMDFPDQHRVNLQDEMDHSLLPEHSRARLADQEKSSPLPVGANAIKHHLPHGSQATAKTTIGTILSTRSFDSPRKADERIVDSDDESLELGISLAQRTNAAALFDEEGDDGSSCLPSPLIAHGHFGVSPPLPSQQPGPFELTPRKRLPPKPDKQFSTPARLRSMRENRSPDAGQEYTDSGNTPEAAKSTFEPSSIVDIGDSDTHNEARIQVSSLHEAHTAYLALPSIQSIPNKQYPSNNRVFPESEDRRKFRYPPLRLAQERNAPVKTPSASVDEDHSLSHNYTLHNDRNERVLDAQPDCSGCNIPNMPSNEQFNEEQRDYARWDTQRRAVSPAVILKDPRKKADERRQDDSSGPTVSSVGGEESDPLSSSEHSMPEGNGKTSLAQHCSKSSDFTRSFDEDRPSHKGEERSGAHSETSCDSPTPAQQVLGCKPVICKPGKCAVAPELTITVASNRQAVVAEEPTSHHESSEKSLLQSLSWDMQNLPIAQNATEGEITPEEQRRLQKTMSWPRARQSFSPAARDPGDTKIRTNRARNPDPGKILNGFGFSRQPGDSNGSKNVPRRFAAPEEGFQKAVEEMIATLSPTPSQTFMDNYFSDAENNEFLSNYFYCVKPKTTKKQLPGSEDYDDGQICRDALCSRIGMENMLSGISFLFPEKDADKSLLCKPEPVKARALSLGNEDSDRDDGWLGMLRMNSSRFSLHFNQAKDDGGDRGLFRFQPPFLKKSSTSSCAWLPEAEPNPPNGSKASRFEKVMMSKDGFLSMSNDEKWNLIQNFSKESLGGGDDQID